MYLLNYGNPSFFKFIWWRQVIQQIFTKILLQIIIHGYTKNVPTF